MGADEAVFLVGQKAVRGEVQRPALVRTDVEPGARSALAPGDDQPGGFTVQLELEFAVLPLGQIVGGAQEHWFIHGVRHCMQDPWQRFYQPPASPLARFGLVLLGIGILALSFLLGLVFLAVAVGMAVIGFVVLTVRRWLGRSGSQKRDDGLIDVEYRVIDRQRDRR